MTEFAPTEPVWRRSSYSADHDNCLEVRRDKGILVRDSRGLEEAVLAFPAAAWKGLLSGV